MTEIVRRCVDYRLAPGAFSGEAEVCCSGYMTDDGEVHDTCGEPCRWIMRKSGHGDPPWGDNFQENPPCGVAPIAGSGDGAPPLPPSEAKVRRVAQAIADELLRQDYDARWMDIESFARVAIDAALADD